MFPFDFTAFAVSGKAGIPLTGLTTPTDCPKSVRNRCVIGIFGCVFVLPRGFFYFSVGEGFFVIEQS